MLDKEKNGFSVRFRKMDDDLKEAIKLLDAGAISELARNGLRLMLGIRTAKQVEVKEKQIVLPAEQTMRTIQSKPAVYIPNQRR
jgi:hypothetical protein